MGQQQKLLTKYTEEGMDEVNEEEEYYLVYIMIQICIQVFRLVQPYYCTQGE